MTRERLFKKQILGVGNKQRELLRLLYPTERGLKSKNFLNNDSIMGNFMRKTRL